MPPLAKQLPSRTPRIPPIRTTLLFEKHEELVREKGPTWKESQPSSSTGKRQESPRHITMPLKHERSEPEKPRKMSPEASPPNSPECVPTSLYPLTTTASPSQPTIMINPGRLSCQGSPVTSTLSTPSSFRLADLYRTPVQTIIEVEDKFMEEGETTNSDLSMEEGQIEDTRQSTPDSMDIGIPRIPSDWLEPSPP